MILKGYPRISETFISNEIQLLEQIGFTIHIYAMRHPRETFSHESVKAIRATVDYLPQTLLAPMPRFIIHNTILGARNLGSYTQALRLVARRFLRTRKSATIKHLLQAGYLVNRLLGKRNVIHLHAHFAHSPTSVAMFASRMSGLPFSFSAHAKDIFTSDARQIREKVALAQFVLTCSEYGRQYLDRISAGTRTPIYRSYHGIDTALFSGTDDRSEPASPYRVLTVARMTAKKGLPTVLRAVRHLTDRGYSLRHTLIGDGDDREKTLLLIDRLGIGTITRWLGTQPHGIVLDHYRKADLFVLGCEIAADGDRDGIPNVFMESMAMGVPVVATQVSAIPEIITDRVTGLLVPPGEPAAMAEAMIRLLTDQALRRRVIPAARRRVAEQFDNRVLIENTAAVFREQNAAFGDGMGK